MHPHPPLPATPADGTLAVLRSYTEPSLLGNTASAAGDFEVAHSVQPAVPSLDRAHRAMSLSMGAASADAAAVVDSALAASRAAGEAAWAVPAAAVGSSRADVGGAAS